jgi:hypothetical protein
MKSSPIRAAAVLAVAFSCSAAAGDPDIPAFKAYEQPAYTLVTHDQYTASEIPGQTERIDAFLRQQLAMPDTASMPTKILVLPTTLDRYSRSPMTPDRFRAGAIRELPATAHSINSPGSVRTVP